MTKVSTIVSKDIAGPNISMPREIFSMTSSCVVPLNANCASIPAFDKSISSKKKNKASLLTHNVRGSEHTIEGKATKRESVPGK